MSSDMLSQLQLPQTISLFNEILYKNLRNLKSRAQKQIAEVNGSNPENFVKLFSALEELKASEQSLTTKIAECQKKCDDIAKEIESFDETLKTDELNVDNFSLVAKWNKMQLLAATSLINAP